ncbi:xanthine dehydrogenase family protein molybdopterin-binding subunit [Aurantivibrio plasticivorans]
MNAPLRDDDSTITLFKTIQQTFRGALSRPQTQDDLVTIDRRSFLKMSAVAGGGLTLANGLMSDVTLAADGEGVDGQFILNAFVHISPDGQITLYSHTPEMGQGVKTAIPMILAEELGASWDDVQIVQAPVNEAVYGEQRAGGSRSLNRNWQPMREMGAMARTMLIAAASKQWQVSASECKTVDSEVIHQPTGRRLPFKAVVHEASLQSVPAKNDLTFKEKEDYTLIGSSITGVDNTAIVTGEPLFGADVKLPNMLYATYIKCPAVYGKVKSANLAEIKKLPGVVDAFVLEGNGDVNQLLDGVAIVAKTTWQAYQARAALKVEWDERNASKDSWTGMKAEAKKIAAGKPQQQRANTGDVDGQFADANNTVVENFYTFPYVAHACMEPMNCTADFRAGKNGQPASLEVWAPTQAPVRIYTMAEQVLGLHNDQVTVHQTRMGGGFGRRGRTDFSSEAASISKRVGAPVHLMWKREDDVQHDFYRAGGFYQFKGAVDKKGKLVALHNHIIGPGIDGRSPVGIYQNPKEFPALCIDNYRGSMSLIDTKTPCGAWRAPGSNVLGWALQSFLAEMSHAAKRDHVEFLLEIMGEPRWFDSTNIRSLNTGRAAGVIKLAAEKSGWGKQLTPGRGMGLAFHFSHAVHVAEVAEVSVDVDVNGKKIVTVHNITAAVDTGPVINRSGAVAQVEGSIVDGLSTLNSLAITMENGRVEQSNFHDYRGMRIAKTPPVDVHFIESDYAPTGLGEPALPPLAGAVCNAIFNACGERITEMPLHNVGFTI